MTTTALPSPPSLNSLMATAPVSLFLDFDGTLIDIASGPDSINVPADISARLKSLADRQEGRLALVSGRGLDNLEQHLGALNIARAGSHGAERIDALGAQLGSTPRLLDDGSVASLRQLAADHGALFEGKRYGAALHYRSVPESGAAIDEAAIEIAEQSGLVTKRGKCVIELVWPGADKGAALAAFMDTPTFTGSIPVFIGDDVTDEDGFAAARRYGGCGIAVGERPSENANYILKTVEDVHVWLNL